jgi:hypothetical protein
MALTSYGIVLQALREGPKTTDELCQDFGVKAPYRAIHFLRLRGYNIETMRSINERKSKYVLHEQFEPWL